MATTSIGPGRRSVFAVSLVIAVYALVFTGDAVAHPMAPDSTCEQKVLNPSGSNFDQYGAFVAISADGRTAVVGALGFNHHRGAAYVYKRNANHKWNRWVTLYDPGSAPGDYFGGAVAISPDGRTIAIGADGANHGRGAVFLYKVKAKSDQKPKLSRIKFTEPDGKPGDQFGNSVALGDDGKELLVGAPGETKVIHGAPTIDVGKAYLFTVQNGLSQASNTPTAVITASDSQKYDSFGNSVALSSDGKTALIGAVIKNAVYIYRRPQHGWEDTSVFTAELTASRAGPNAYFGWSVALSANGRTALVGAVGVDTLRGAGYVYTRPKRGWKSTSRFDAKLRNRNAKEADGLGTSTALANNGREAFLGPASANAGLGAVYMYKSPKSGWKSTGSYSELIETSDAKLNGGFGGSFSADRNGRIILIGASSSGNSGTPIDSAYFRYLGKKCK